MGAGGAMDLAIHSFINIYGLASCCSRSCSGPVCLFAVVLFCFFFVWGAGVVRGDICVFMMHSSLGQVFTQMFSAEITVFFEA